MEGGAVKQLTLSPFDQTIVRIFVHKLFCFEFPDSGRQAEAVECLKDCLSAAIQRWPFIAGEVVPDDTRENQLQLRYTTPIVGEPESKVLIVKQLTKAEFPRSYQELMEAGMPPSAFKADVLAAVPEWPTAGGTYPALSIQANFVEGGLIVCFAFHHAVADGASFCTFLKEFTSLMKHPRRADSVTEVMTPMRLKYINASNEEIIPLRSFPEYSPGSVPVHLPRQGRVTTRILTISATTVRMLEEAVSKYLKSTTGADTWVSNIACLSSLIWVATVRARQHRLDLTETVKIGIAVNIRGVMNPPLPEDYFGNGIVHTNAIAKAHELLAGDPAENTIMCHSSIPVNTVAEAALRMRQAVRGVDSTFVHERLKTFSNLADPCEVVPAYECALDNANTGIDFSSWRDQGADIDFNIPGTVASTVGTWRKTWSPNEGAYNILPRKGGSKGSADWEISLGLSVEDMEKVCSASELGAWLTRIAE